MSISVEIINPAPNQLEALILTKSGRLATGSTFDDVMAMSEEEKMEHLSYMLDTIKTSFEFVDYMFQIKGVSRAFTHQFVRTRTASFQQESQRTVDASDNGYLVTTDHPAYKKAADIAFELYEDMICDGVNVQDARGILPTATFTTIYAKANLRTLSQMADMRLCKRTEGEYQDVFKEMVKAILAIHPWADTLLKPHCVRTATCAFPRYTKCPVQAFCIKPWEFRDKIEEVWSRSTHVAAPKVNKNGGTM